MAFWQPPCGIDPKKITAISNESPNSPMEFTVDRIDTGWNCSVTGCEHMARVATCGWKLCEPHAKRFNHGYGESITALGKDFKAK